MSYILTLAWKCFKIVSARGKFFISFFTLLMILIASIDGFALNLLSKSISSYGNIPSSKSTFQFSLIATMFLTKSVLASIGTYYTLKQISHEEVSIGSANFERYQKLTWSDKSKIKLNDLINIVDRGPNAVTQSVLFLTSFLIAEIGSVSIVIVFFIFIDPLTAIASLSIFTIMALIQNYFLSKSALKSGVNVKNFEARVFDLLEDSHLISKTLAVMHSKTLKQELSARLTALARSRSTSVFLESLPRYSTEIMLIIGSSMVVGSIVIWGNSDELFVSLAVFGVAGFRILPSINRLQGLILGIFSKAPFAYTSVNFSALDSGNVLVRQSHKNLTGDQNSIIELKSVSFRYSPERPEVIKGISLSIRDGLQYAFVGPSGSGKTTLADLCLGLLEPTSGEIFRRFESGNSSVAYVPQDSTLIRGAIDHNITLEWSKVAIDNYSMYQAIKDSELNYLMSDYFSSTAREQLELSGGQKQRVSLARALYRQPKLLVMDEPTSSLDADHESKFIDSINALKGRVTTIIIAHRLTTVQRADVVIYMDSGHIRGIGTFSNLKNTIPDFANQVNLGTFLAE